MRLGGPIASAADLLALAQYFFERCCQYTQVGPLLLLPIYSLGPIISLEDTADQFRWAYCCCCQFSHFGPLFLWEKRPIHQDRSIAFLLLLLPIYSFGPIISSRRAADELRQAHRILLLILPIYPFGPIVSSGGIADALEWAYCCCCQFARLGPLFLLEEWLIHSDGPIAFCCCFH